MAYSYNLLVYKKDRRCKNGVRLVKSYPYNGYSDHAMMDEIRDLKRNLYKSDDGWVLDFEPLADNVV